MKVKTTTYARPLHLDNPKNTQVYQITCTQHLYNTQVLGKSKWQNKQKNTEWIFRLCMCIHRGILYSNKNEQIGDNNNSTNGSHIHNSD